MKTFELSDTQEQFVDQWFERHVCIDNTDKNSLVYEFSSSGIGSCIIVRCSRCNAAIDVSEYDKW